MNSLVVYLMLLLCTLNLSVHCSYPLAIEDDRIPLAPYLYSTSTVVYNDTIYSYGGNKKDNGFNGTDKMFSYTLNQTTGDMDVKLENEGQGPICKFCSAVLFPGSTEILVFSEPNYNETSVFFHNQSMWQPNQTVLPHFYDIVTKKWRVEQLPQKTGQDDAFYSRNYPTTVMNGNDGVYVLGGYHFDNIYRTDGWYYSRHENSYTTISLPFNHSYVDAIGYIDLDGNLAFVGGCNQSLEFPDTYINCINLQFVNIYHNSTNTWNYTVANLSSHMPTHTLSGSASQVDYIRKRLYVSGGRYKGAISQSFLFLDLEKNIWVAGSPDGNSYNPVFHFSSSGALIRNNTYFVRLFGMSPTKNTNSELNTVDVLNLTFASDFDYETYKNKIHPIQWISSILHSDGRSSKNKKALYIGLSCGLVAALALAVFLYFKRRSLSKYWNGFCRALLWNPRKGEPVSTEIARLLVKTVSLGILVSVLAYYINDVRTSTISTTSSSYISEVVTVPDFRICYSGWVFASEKDRMKPSCHYLTGGANTVCPLDFIESFYYTPQYESQSQLSMTCYMFAPKDPVYLGSENSSIRIITSGKTHRKNEVIYMQLYRRDQNGNRVIFNNEPRSNIAIQDIQNWAQNETLNGLQVNAFPNSFTTIEYQETDYQKLRNDSIWNYFGAFPDLDISTELSIVASQPVIPNTIDSTQADQGFYNTFTLIPKDFTRTTTTEKRDSTLLHVLGSIGGVVSLLLSVQVILFGNRPNSPWGVFHYWTWKKKSTPPDLGKQFRIEEAQVPFINPVHQRFNDIFKKNSDIDKLMDASSSSSIPLVNKDRMEDRMARLEARNQLLELIMKNYYLDDQVFLALGYSQRTPEEEDIEPENPKLNNEDSEGSDEEDNAREPEDEKFSFDSDIPIIDSPTTIHSNKKKAY